MTTASENRKRIVINLDYIMPNRLFVYPIYSFDGEKLLDVNEILTAQKIKTIVEKYGNKVYYFSSDDVSTPEFNNLYTSFVKKTQNMFGNILQDGTITDDDYRNSEEIVLSLIRDLEHKEIIAAEFLKGIENFDDYIFYHSVNVCLLTVMVLKWKKKYTQDIIKNIVLGAFYSDFGMLKLNKKILDKPDKLSKDEFLEIRSHPQIGYNIFKNINNINPIVLQTILFHHEQFDDEGYYSLPYETLPFPSKIVSICSMYDALTSPRPYREAYSSSTAMKLIVNSINGKFDYNLVSDFINSVGLILNNLQLFYRKGDFCILNTHEICLISEAPIGDYLRPRVIVFARYDYSEKNIKTKFYDHPVEIDLSKDLNRRINSLVVRRELIDALRNKLTDRKTLTDYLYVSPSEE
ncbi:MAG: hypothetical protein FWH53_02895 [Leptospirales bacterium]|nr:hypothetical protein [Leptospirales bacterium]